VFETRFPLRVADCELVQDSGGPGKYRGGLGYWRTLLATQVEINGAQCATGT
jgi:5-oxoprolinase (ATP-hydrolysing)/N-methylhydantoinase B